MFNFFADENSRRENSFVISGADFNHIKNVLRMKIGEELLISFGGTSHLCKISEFSEGCVTAEIIYENYADNSLNIKLCLFQALPKGDKMEFIIQKAVELGASAVYPFESKNCVVKLDDKKKKSKTARWQLISQSAAKQSKASCIAEVFEPLSFDKALKEAEKMDLILVPYENKDGMKATKNALLKIKPNMTVGIFIGSEGGFTEDEIQKLSLIGGEAISLGRRILRCETAAVTALSMCMLYAETELYND